jgi:poly-gamma-glutamate synthesis protein (capsule biosynthesis protein)
LASTRSSKKRKSKHRRRRLIVALVGALLLLAAILIYIAASGGLDLGSGRARNAGSAGDGNAGTETEQPAKHESIDLELLCAGDVMLHNPQLNGAARSGGTYDFSGYFPYVRPYIEAADLALVNLELTFGGPPYNGYPLFSVPDEMATAVKEAGFDVAITANNHMLDTRQAGVIRTAQVARGAGLLVTGSSETPDERDWLVTEVKGVKVGVVAYTYETTGGSGSRTINGNPLSEETRALINSYSPARMDEDMQAVRASIDGARADGAELVVCYFHWGEEYQRQPNDAQRRAAEYAVSFGADIIFASHPHVLQPFEFLSDENGRQVPVFWSMGNFVSNQRVETLDNRYTEQGIMAKVNLTLDGESRDIVAMQMSYIPTWVERWRSSAGTYNYTIVPLTEGFESNPDVVAASGTARAQQALSDITSLLGPVEGVGFDKLAAERARKAQALEELPQVLETLKLPAA